MIFFTSLLQAVLQSVLVHLMSDNTTLRTSLLLQVINMCLIPAAVLDKDIVQTSISVGRAMGKLLV